MEQGTGTSSPGNTKPGSPKVPSKRRNHFVTFWTYDYPRELPHNCTYLVTCEDKTKDDKYHGHAFVYFKNPVAMAAVKKLFGKDCHVEKPLRNSSAISYVKGLNGPHRKTNILEYGKAPMDNGVHSMEAVLGYNTIEEVMENMPDTYVRFRSGIRDCMNNKLAKKAYWKPPLIHWLYGPTGSGKTRTAIEAGARCIEYNDGFFTDWGDARIICVEELRGEIPYRKLLKLTDEYHNYYTVNIKGGTKLIDVDEIFITSPYRPEDVYRNQVTRDDSIDQLLRRINDVTEYYI